MDDRSAAQQRRDDRGHRVAGPHASRHPNGTTATTGWTPRGRASERPTATRSGARLRLVPDSEDGFTLVELLVVVLMLVALVGIAVPTFVGQRDGAVKAAVQSELRTAAIALESYRAQNGVYSADALSDASYGYVPSLEVVSVLDATSVGADFCVLAWYEPAGDPSDERGEATIADARAKAEWAISSSGLEYVGAGDAARDCS